MGDSYRCYNCNTYKYEDLFGWWGADVERGGILGVRMFESEKVGGWWDG